MTGETLCAQELDILQSIDVNIKNLVGDINENTSYEHGVWTAKRKGKSVTYIYLFTYAGVTTTINLEFLKHVQINRIEQMWNDATAKDFSIRAYAEASSAYYVELNTKAANTDTSILNQFGTEYKYPLGSRLQFYYANYTVGKICKIVVQVDEL